MAVFGIAAQLHKTVAEISQMTVDEFHGWVAFFNGSRNR